MAESLEVIWFSTMVATPPNFQVVNQSLPEHFLGERTSLVSNKEKGMGSNTDKLKS